MSAVAPGDVLLGETFGGHRVAGMLLVAATLARVDGRIVRAIRARRAAVPGWPRGW